MAKSRRYPHKIPSKVSTSKPKNIILFDTETEPTKVNENKTLQTLKLYVYKHVAYQEDGEYEIIKEEQCYNKEDIVNYLDRLSNSIDMCYIASHNLVFDFTVLSLLEQLEQNNFELLQFYTKQLATQFTYQKGICTFIYFDTVSLFPNKLSKLGEIVGIDKLDIDFSTTTDKELFIYCGRDVDILVRMLSYWYKFLNTNNLGGFRTTLAATAFTSYRHKYMNTSIDIHCDDEVNGLERGAYRGGRVELFYKGYPGQGEYYKLDINSMYPFVMKNERYPTKLIKQYEDVKVAYLENRLNRYNCVANVTIQTNNTALSTKICNRNIYAKGVFNTTLTTPELKYVLKTGRVLSVHKLATYQSANIFNDYVSDMYNIRMQAKANKDMTFYLIAKLLLNSLYGKFGQLNTEQEYFGLDKDNKYNREYGYCDVTKRRYTITTINHKAYIEYYGGESSFSFPAIAAHVTAYARLYLYKLMLLCGEKNLYYVDTDSLTVNKQGLNNLLEYIDNNELGKLKIENTANRIILHAPKDYRFGNEKKLKGISKTAKKIASNRYAQEKWARFAGLMLSDNPNQYYLYQMEKRLKRLVYSGKIGENGWLTPWELPTDYETVVALIKSV